MIVVAMQRAYAASAVVMEIDHANLITSRGQTTKEIATQHALATAHQRYGANVRLGWAHRSQSKVGMVRLIPAMTSCSLPDDEKDAISIGLLNKLGQPDAAVKLFSCRWRLKNL